MSDHPPSARPPLRERFFRALLLLHPRWFRERHGNEMMRFFRESWADLVEGSGVAVNVAFWTRTVRGTVATALLQRLRVGEYADSTEKRGGDGMRPDIVMGEVRLAFRSLRRRPGMSLVVILTLGLGLGANAAVYSVLESVLVAPLPYEQSDQLVRIYGRRLNRPGQSRGHLPAPGAAELRDQVPGLASVAVLDNYSAEAVDVTGHAQPERVTLLRVSAEYFDVLGVSPIVGRTFDRSEEHAETRSVIVREDLWQRYLGGSRDAIGRPLTLDGEAFTVVGVVSDAVKDPLDGRIDIWAPANLTGGYADNWDNNYLTAFARMSPGTDFESLRAELDVIEARHEAISEDAAQSGYAIVPLKEDLVGTAEPLLAALMGAVLFLLVLTCVNVAGILLAGAAAKEREFAIRASLGSPRTGLVRLFMIETGLLAMAGAGVGLLVGQGALGLLLAVAPAGIPRSDEIAFGPNAMALGAVVTVAIGVLLGLTTSLPFTRPSANQIVTGSRTGGTTPMRRRARSVLVAVEVSLAVVLLIGAGVLLRTVQELRSRDLGADPRGVLTFQVGLPDARYASDDLRNAFHDDFHQRVAAIPGVTSVGATTRLPVTGGFNSWGTRPAIAVGEPEDVENIQVNQRWVYGDFFAAAHVELLAGRLFAPADDPEAERAVVVNETLVQRLLQDDEAIGRLLRIGGWYTRIIGIVEDEALTARGGPVPMAYHSLRQWPGRGLLTQMVRTEGDLAALVPAIRAELAEVDPDLVLFQPTAMSEVVGQGIAQERFAAALLTVFGALAVLLAGLGLYGVLSHMVRTQQHEIGVRIALGADLGGVRSMVVKRGLRLAAMGAVAGILLAVGLTRTLGFLLFEVSANDPVVFVAAPAALLAIALGSSYLPAYRASRVDPVESFRAD